MIPRYARPPMTAIWEAENRYRIWFEIEAHATEALGELGVVPRSAAQALWAWWATNPRIDVAAIDAIEAVTKHDVIAFLTWVAEQVGDEARFMHQGMTSSDVLDTCLAVQLARQLASGLPFIDMRGDMLGHKAADRVAHRLVAFVIEGRTRAPLVEQGGFHRPVLTAWAGLPRAGPCTCRCGRHS